MKTKNKIQIQNNNNKYYNSISMMSDADALNHIKYKLPLSCPHSFWRMMCSGVSAQTNPDALLFLCGICALYCRKSVDVLSLPCRCRAERSPLSCAGHPHLLPASSAVLSLPMRSRVWVCEPTSPQPEYVFHFRGPDILAACRSVAEGLKSSKCTSRICLLRTFRWTLSSQ